MPNKITYYTRYCKICGVKFETTRFNKNICSFECKQERTRQRSREYKDLLNAKELPRLPDREITVTKDLTECAVCGFDLTVDWHHYGKSNMQIIALCPNHHALHHRNIQKIVVLKYKKRARPSTLVSSPFKYPYSS